MCDPLLRTMSQTSPLDICMEGNPFIIRAVTSPKNIVPNGRHECFQAQEKQQSSRAWYFVCKRQHQKHCYSLYATYCKHIAGLNQNPCHKSLRGDSWSDTCSSTKPAPSISAAPARVVETALRGMGSAFTTNSAEELTLPLYSLYA